MPIGGETSGDEEINKTQERGTSWLMTRVCYELKYEISQFSAVKLFKKINL